jgi:predicted Zn-dependent peptidase
MATALGITAGISPDVTAQKIEFEEYDLENGLHVILHEDRSTPIVTVSVMYHVGSKDEDPDRRGFAHFFEHLLFEGSKNIDRGEFSKYVERAGGMLNANTTADRTYYYEVLPSNELELGLWLESERMMHAKVESIGIETQREVVKEERRQRYENQPYGSLLIEVLDRAYTKHPYKWPTIGFMEDLNAASEKDYQEFYKNYYVPNNAVLCVAGDFDRKKVKGQIERYFGEIKKGKEVKRTTIEEPAMNGEVRDVVYDKIQLPAVVQAYRIPAYGSDDYYAVDMLNQLLSQGNSSRLQRKVKDEKQLALNVGAYSFPFEHPGLTMAFAIANVGVDPDTLEAAMDEEVEVLQSELLSEKEYNRLLAQLEMDFVNSNSKISGVANSLCRYHTFLGDASLVNEEIERYRKVTPEDIRRVAKTYYTKDNRVVLHYLPMSAKQ